MTEADARKVHEDAVEVQKGVDARAKQDAQIKKDLRSRALTKGQLRAEDEIRKRGGRARAYRNKRAEEHKNRKAEGS